MEVRKIATLKGVEELRLAELGMLYGIVEMHQSIDMEVGLEDKEGQTEEPESCEMTYTLHDLAVEVEQPTYFAAILNVTDPVVSEAKLTDFGSLIHYYFS